MTLSTAFVWPTKVPNTPLQSRIWAAAALGRVIIFCGMCATLSVWAITGHAQATVSSASAPVAAKVAASAPVGRLPTGGPLWAELALTQQEALKPLAATWSSISATQKRKWLELSKNYPSLPPEDRVTLHSRMNEWATLSPQQRSQARLNFAKTRELSVQLTPDQKKATWQDYQALSGEEKQRLAAKASPKANGAATAVKPVAPQRLAAVPVHSPKSTAKPQPQGLDQSALEGIPLQPGLTPSPVTALQR